VSIVGCSLQFSSYLVRKVSQKAVSNMDGGQKLVKWLLLIFNLIFWTFGIGLIIAGAVAQTLYKPYFSFLDSTYTSAPVLLIVIGAIITIIAFFGCCGSSKENYCMLMTFSVLLGIIFVVELAGGIAAYVERGRVHEYVEKNMRHSIRHYNATTADKPLWDDTQVKLMCCGVHGYSDWLWNATIIPGVVPASCCKIPATNITACDRSEANLRLSCSRNDTSDTSVCPVFEEGCLDSVEDKMENNIAAIGGVGIGVAFIQVIGIALACFLARRVRRGYTYSS